MNEEKLHKEFLEDLSSLLKKYNAELTTELRSDGYNGYNCNDVYVVEFNGVYEGENQRSYSQLDLPTYLD